MLQEDKELVKKMTPNYDDFNLKTCWQMKKKFVFAKPGKKRFVSLVVGSQLGNKSASALQQKLTQQKK